MTRPGQKPGAFLTDVKELRRRARAHMERGAVTDSYQADRKTVLTLLDTSLATELVCVLRYRRHYFTASGIHAQAVAAEFLTHSTEEQAHADPIAHRIDIAVGVIGAFLGGWIFSTVPGIGGGGLFMSLFMAFIGAIALLWLIRLVAPSHA